MGYIYCITNVINGKKYIGKTTFSVTKRFREHCKDSTNDKYKDRALYKAMNKYGVENFLVETLIECDDEELSSYEILFIEELDTYKNGYNFTIGGDGKQLFSHKEIIKLNKEGLSNTEIAQKLQCCPSLVKEVLYSVGLCSNKVLTGSCKSPITVIRMGKSGGIIEEYSSIAEAGKWLVNNGYAKVYNGGVRQKISLVCQGKLKTAYSFKWKYK